jgi:hypothetical protein
MRLRVRPHGYYLAMSPVRRYSKLKQMFCVLGFMSILLHDFLGSRGMCETPRLGATAFNA